MRHSVILLMVLLPACAKILPEPVVVAPKVEETEVTEDNMRPVARPDGLILAAAPPPSARTAEEFDTTTEAEREKAAEVPQETGEKALGSTIASLGDPAKPGFWLETPLVTAQSEGRVEYQGKSSAVTLIPIDGPATAGSRLSLAAMRLIEAPLTGLPEVSVFRN